jgi:hypothetical protein
MLASGSAAIENPLPPAEPEATKGYIVSKKLLPTEYPVATSPRAVQDPDAEHVRL